MDSNLTRPIIGIENRTPQEVFDIMCERITSRESVGGVLRHVHLALESSEMCGRCGRNFRDEVHYTADEVRRRDSAKTVRTT